LASKSKIPPQIAGAVIEVGELVGDSVQTFGFHCVVPSEKNAILAAGRGSGEQQRAGCCFQPR
jgi:hypothetical protein